MSNIYTSADQLIGKTPLLELTHIEKKFGLKAKVLAKLEYFNPAGSVKDRIAYAMITDAEEKGLLKEGSVIIEMCIRDSACTGAGSLGLAVASGGFTVTHHQSTPLDSRFLRLNFSGKTYGYVAMG